MKPPQKLEEILKTAGSRYEIKFYPNTGHDFDRSGSTGSNNAASAADAWQRTLAFLRAFLEAAGYRVHVYTSPHLVRFNERIRLAGTLIDEATLLALLDECERVNAGAPITFFEITTAVAFLAFARIPADIVLLETGLGGRFDATNLIARPAVTAITPKAPIVVMKYAMR